MSSHNNILIFIFYRRIGTSRSRGYLICHENKIYNSRLDLLADYIRQVYESDPNSTLICGRN